MSEEALRSRLEALNRGPLPPGVRLAPTDRSADSSATSRPALRLVGAGEPEGFAWRSGLVRPIPGLVRRGEPVVTSAGEHLRICLALDDVWPGGEALVRRRFEAVRQKQRAAEPQNQRGDWLAGFPDAFVFLDLETCGLAGSAMFLAGVLGVVDGTFRVELLLARDYSEEPAVLATLWQRLTGVSAIVTFNGKSFDWPMAIDRSRRHRMQAPMEPVKASIRHVDLLHLARRRWRRELPDCKLQTLERHICGRVRADDIPSNQIPAAYQQFVRTGFDREMDAILLHNAVDLVTMLDLAMRLADD